VASKQEHPRLNPKTIKGLDFRKNKWFGEATNEKMEDGKLGVFL
jgi:hypothetical protein